MNEEQQNVQQSRPDEYPDYGAPITVVVQAIDGDNPRLLDRIRHAWFVTASDDDYSEEEIAAALADRLPVDVCAKLPLDLEYDRDWIWWSSAVVGDYIKIDLVQYAIPNSFGTLWRTIEVCGGEIIVQMNWVDSFSLDDAVQEFRNSHAPDEL